MNYLAHTLLARGDADLEVGGILGDYVRGRPDPALPAGLRRGIMLHRAVDTYTDQHAEVVAARALFEPPFRRYAGIMLDVWFDHCLARDFARWSDSSLDAFSIRLRERLDARAQWLPPRLHRFAAFMHERNLPAAYARPEVIGEVLTGLGQRLSRANPLDQALPQLSAREATLNHHFGAFFPDLVQFAETWRSRHPA
ncbi:MAG TPA: ACP phosphodiesterase [Oleiagrimonas sp.]|nr:ACP phosphodiesterase [Oleiagrimonas sp.]